MSNVGQCRRFLVNGRVQGVFYRASTREYAMALGLNGYARNLDDGRVEVLACGARASLEALETWLWQGPSRAEVEHVDVEQIPDDGSYDSFVIS